MRANTNCMGKTVDVIELLTSHKYCYSRDAIGHHSITKQWSNYHLYRYHIFSTSAISNAIVTYSTGSDPFLIRERPQKCGQLRPTRHDIPLGIDEELPPFIQNTDSPLLTAQTSTYTTNRVGSRRRSVCPRCLHPALYVWYCEIMQFSFQKSTSR